VTDNALLDLLYAAPG